MILIMIVNAMTFRVNLLYEKLTFRPLNHIVKHFLSFDVTNVYFCNIFKNAVFTSTPELYLFNHCLFYLFSFCGKWITKFCCNFHKK